MRTPVTRRCALALLYAGFGFGCSARGEGPVGSTPGGAAASSGGTGNTGSAGGPPGGSADATGSTGFAGLVPGSAGFAGSAPGSAGASGSSGSTGGAGALGGNGPDAGVSAGTGGGAPGGVAGSACAGIPIVPDADGFVAPGSNALGIHGSWFEYSDCTDLKNVDCSTVKSPAANSFANVGGKLCTSGYTSTAAGAWGAGIGLELNDAPPQMPYDTTVHRVKGFCFSVSGTTLPSTTIRVAFPTKNNNDNAYFLAVSTFGQHTVLFSDTAQGSWVKQKSAFEPTAVMLLQFQIPASPTAVVPWDFCIEGLTAVVQ